MTQKVLIAIAVALAGCMPNISAHENFHDGLQRLVGEEIDIIERRHFLGYWKDQIGEKMLPNGNTEYHYKLPLPLASTPKKDCIYVVEFDSETGIIKKVRVMSGDEVCIIPP